MNSSLCKKIISTFNPLFKVIKRFISVRHCEAIRRGGGLLMEAVIPIDRMDFYGILLVIFVIGIRSSSRLE
ncbi:MAG: hypothetical protein KDJ22_18160 [Candidatus Competibacteraceae bacterium]|nr:hypothetical protein [Candidatus Competibacteraceae bacterium]